MYINRAAQSTAQLITLHFSLLHLLLIPLVQPHDLYLSVPRDESCLPAIWHCTTLRPRELSVTEPYHPWTPLCEIRRPSSDSPTPQERNTTKDMNSSATRGSFVPSIVRPNTCCTLSRQPRDTFARKFQGSCQSPQLSRRRWSLIHHRVRVDLTIWRLALRGSIITSCLDQINKLRRPRACRLIRVSGSSHTSQKSTLNRKRLASSSTPACSATGFSILQTTHLATGCEYRQTILCPYNLAPRFYSSTLEET